MTREPVSGVILAGGLSTRLGRDKASEVLAGRSLLQHVVDRLEGLVDECVVVAAAGQRLPEIATSTALHRVDDAYTRIGPLGGIYTGLAAMQAPRAITVACDMPLLQVSLLEELLRLAPGHDAVVPVNGLTQPLCAVYSATCLSAIKARIDAGRYKVTGFLDEVDVLYVEPAAWRRVDPEGLSFQNINDEDDLRRAQGLLEGSRVSPLHLEGEG